MSGRSFQREWVLPVGAAALLWGCAFAMACGTEGVAVLRGPPGQSALDRLLGASRVAFGENFFLQADTYFHKGVEHVQEEALTNSVFVRVNRSMKPHDHLHAEGYSLREILPWLKFATRMDPHNVVAYLVTAHWVSTALKRPDIAESVLLEAQRNNPRDYRILNERARLAFRAHDDQKAARLLDVALRVWPRGVENDEEQARLDRSQMLSYRAFLFGVEGDSESAMRYWRGALAMNPENQVLARRVELMENGMDLAQEDRRTWESVFGAHDDEHDHSQCDHDHEHEHEGGGPGVGSSCIMGGKH